MIAPLRLLDTGEKPARWNVAMTAALAELHGAGSVPDTLRLHVYRRSVLIGRHQAVSQAVDSGACRQRRIEIARRVTGGGAVYMSPGVLAWDLVAGRSALGRSLDVAAAAVCGAVAAGLARLGIAARYRPPNEIAAGGRKLAGASGCFDGPTLVHQGAILIDPDRAEMAAALALPASTLCERTVTVHELIRRVPERAELAAALVAAMADALGRRAVREEPSAAELRLAEELLGEEIGSDAFVAGDGLPAAPASAEARSVPA